MARHTSLLLDLKVHMLALTTLTENLRPITRGASSFEGKPTGTGRIMRAVGRIIWRARVAYMFAGLSGEVIALRSYSGKLEVEWVRVKGLRNKDGVTGITELGCCCKHRPPDQGATECHGRATPPKKKVGPFHQT